MSYVEQSCALEDPWKIYRQLSVRVCLLDPSMKQLPLSLDRLHISGIYPLTLLFGYGIPLLSTNDITFFQILGPFRKIHDPESRKGKETHKNFPSLLVKWNTFQYRPWRVEGMKHPSSSIQMPQFFSRQYDWPRRQKCCRKLRAKRTLPRKLLGRQD